MPDYAKAKVAATKIFDLFDRVPKINNWNNNDGMILPSIDGEISFKSVEFSYPTRSEVKVLNGLNLTIYKGQRIALVGSSGCGKSTVTQLLERFYDPDSGEITINNVNIQSINLQWLRSQIGIVSQEPILFDASIRENIAYGDNTREVSMEEIINAAKQANIHDFISNLPNVSVLSNTNIRIQNNYYLISYKGLWNKRRRQRYSVVRWSKTTRFNRFVMLFICFI